MKIVITGATGHLGRYTTFTLAQAGHEVVALSRSGTMPKAPFGFVEGAGRIRPGKLDIDSDACIATLEAELGPDVALVHLAAWHPPATAATSAADRLRLIETNVYGTMRVLEAARKQRGGVARVIYASTFEVYGALESDGPISEATRTTPLTDYGATKLSGEDHLISFGAEENVLVVALRLPAIYGPGEHTPRALPNFLKQVASGTRPVIQGDGSDLRDEVHARDAARAILCALTSREGGIFNISDGQSHTIRELASTALEVSGMPGQPTFAPAAKPKRDYHMVIDRARTVLGYEPSVTLRDGMREQYQADYGR